MTPPNKSTPIIIILLIVTIAAVVFMTQYKPKEEIYTPKPKTQTATTTLVVSTEPYTLATVAIHSTPADCWTVVNNSVYNVTSWIVKHPGGQKAIVRMCGVDASDAFNGKHGGQARPASELSGFKIGELIK